METGQVPQAVVVLAGLVLNVGPSGWRQDFQMRTFVGCGFQKSEIRRLRNEHQFFVLAVLQFRWVPLEQVGQTSHCGLDTQRSGTDVHQGMQLQCVHIHHVVIMVGGEVAFVEVLLRQVAFIKQVVGHKHHRPHVEHQAC